MQNERNGIDEVLIAPFDVGVLTIRATNLRATRDGPRFISFDDFSDLILQRLF
jgi:hypothetical protein